MVLTRPRRLQLLLDLLGQHLAQLHTPLVEGVDVPDGALGEGQVLVVRDQSTQRRRGDLLGQDRGGGAVAQERLVRHQVVRRTLGLDLLGRLPDHQGLGLGQEVGRQHALVLAALDGVVRLGGHEEVGGDELGTLVQQLEEAVLGVGGGLAEQDGARGVLDVLAGAGDGFAVALHGELLQVGGEPVQVLVERRHEVRLGAKEVAVPDAQQATKDRDVLLQGSLSEVLVHGVGTGQELMEVVEANVEGDRQTDGAPHGVATTHPGLEAEHVLLVNAELGDLLLVGGQGHEVLGDVRVILGRLQEPRLRAVGVGGGFGCGKGLGGDQEKGSLGVRVLESLGDVGAVNVGHEVQLHPLLAIWLQGLGHHHGTPELSWSVTFTVGVGAGDSQVGATNADVDDGVDLLATVTLPLAAADLLGELLHVLKHGVDVLNDALAIDMHGLVGDVAQSDMVDGPVFGEVDVLALEHGIAELLHLGFLGQFDQQGQGVLREEILRVVEKDIRVIHRVGKRAAELVEALGVLFELLLQDDVPAHGIVVVLKLLPGMEIGSLRETRHVHYYLIDLCRKIKTGGVSYQSSTRDDGASTRVETGVSTHLVICRIEVRREEGREIVMSKRKKGRREEK